MTDRTEPSRVPHEVTLTLRRYGITVPDSELPHVVQAYELVRGFADQLAALPDVTLTSPAQTLNFRSAF